MTWPAKHRYDPGVIAEPARLYRPVTPCAEPLWSQFLRALAGAGRPAEAVGEYHRAREILAAELGVDPSQDLQEVYRTLLQARPACGRPGDGGSP